MVAAFAVLPFALIGDDPPVRSFVVVSAVLNGLNLLPVGVLDGGRLARILGAPRWLGWLSVGPTVILSPALALLLAIAALPGFLLDAPHAAYPRTARVVAASGCILAAGMVGVAWTLAAPRRGRDRAFPTNRFRRCVVSRLGSRHVCQGGRDGARRCRRRSGRVPDRRSHARSVWAWRPRPGSSGP